MSTETLQLVTIVANGVLIPIGAWMARSVAALDAKLARVEALLDAGTKVHEAHAADISGLRARIERLDLEVARIKGELGMRN